MAPTLDQGWTVRVVPIGRAPRSAEIVAIAGANGWIVHRVVQVVAAGGRTVVLHRGDNHGRLASCELERVRGRVVGVVTPPGQQLAVLAQSPVWVRRGWCLARCLALAYGACWRCAPGLMGRPAARSLVRWLRRAIRQ